MKILIRGGNFSNKGDEGMLRTVVAEVARLVPEAEFCVILAPGQAEYAHASGINPVERRGGLLRNALAVLAGSIRSVGSLSTLLQSRTAAWQMAAVGPVDGVLDISGFGYSDVWGLHGPRTACAWVNHCRRRRIPYLCLPQAWGPFTNPAIARCVRRFCGKASEVYARDERSLAHLRGLLGADGRRVKLAPDIAFAFRGLGPEAGAAILRRHGVDPIRRPLIGITPNMRVYERTRGSAFGNEYLQFLSRAARHLMREWQATIVLIPHEIKLGRPAARDDRHLCGILETLLHDEGVCAALSGSYLADAIRSVYHHLDLLIGSRYHSLVYALSAGVPVVAVGWAHKYAELLRLFGLERFTIEYTELGDDLLQKVLREAWPARENSRGQIRACLPSIQEQVTEVFSETGRVLEGIRRAV
jgi:colanic acid/amylovoran biosynthesis protein